MAVSCTAIGCADVDAPSGGWVKRSSAGEALFGCSDRLATWKLRCKGDEWIGIRHNCTRGAPVHYRLLGGVQSASYTC